MKVFVLNGPNLNLLGEREPEVYGTTTLADIEKMVKRRAEDLRTEVEFRQTNHEGVLVDWLQESRGHADGVVLNPAALSHYSLAVKDAVVACGLPVVEVHLSNIFGREPWRAKSVISGVAAGVIVGLGPLGYVRALEAVVAILES